jgi:hypothetical protein
MNKKEIKTLTRFYTKRIATLDYVIEHVPGTMSNINEMRKEYQIKLDELSAAKEYMITFESGGWNTTRATNDEDALKFAKAEYDGKHTKVKSVRIATKEGIDAAMRNFY